MFDSSGVQAVAQAQEYIAEGYRWVVDLAGDSLPMSIAESGRR